MRLTYIFYQFENQTNDSRKQERKQMKFTDIACTRFEAKPLLLLIYKEKQLNQRSSISKVMENFT